MRLAWLLSAVAAAVMFATGCGGDRGDRPSQQQASHIPRVEFAVPTAIRAPSTVSVPLGGAPGPLVAADEGVWVTVNRGERGDHRIVRIDPATNRVAAKIPVDGSPHRIAAGEGSVWVTGDFGRGGDVLHRIDPETNRVVATIPFPGRSAGPVATGHGAVWLVLTGDEAATVSLARIDPRTNKVGLTIPLEAGAARHSFDELAVSDGAVWVLALEGLDSPGDVLRVDPTSGRIAARIEADALNTGGGPGGLWITGCVDCDEYRSTFFAQEVNANANASVGRRIAIRDVSSSPLFVGDESVWFSGHGGDVGTVVFRLDPETHAIEEFLRVGHFVQSGMAFDVQNTAVWIGRVVPPSVVRVQLDGRS